MNISDCYKEEKKVSLHEERWNKSVKNAIDKKLGFSEEALNPNSETSNLHGKDLTIKPMIYYNITDCLNTTMNNQDFKDKALKNIGIIKALRTQKGQRLSDHEDVKDIEGEFGRGFTRGSVLGKGPYAVKFHNIVREWLGTVCWFTIKEQNIGFGQTKRKGYCIEKVSVFYYAKNGIHIGMEQILKIAFWMNPKKEPRKR